LLFVVFVCVQCDTCAMSVREQRLAAMHSVLHACLLPDLLRLIGQWLPEDWQWDNTTAHGWITVSHDKKTAALQGPSERKAEFRLPLGQHATVRMSTAIGDEVCSC
jgi:hypothetical protein